LAWLALWALLLLIASWVWQVRIRAALAIWRLEDIRETRD